jgi:hypothetical protein
MSKETLGLSESDIQRFAEHGFVATEVKLPSQSLTPPQADQSFWKDAQGNVFVAAQIPFTAQFPSAAPSPPTFAVGPAGNQHLVAEFSPENVAPYWIDPYAMNAGYNNVYYPDANMFQCGGVYQPGYGYDDYSPVHSPVHSPVNSPQRHGMKPGARKHQTKQKRRATTGTSNTTEHIHTVSPETPWEQIDGQVAKFAKARGAPEVLKALLGPDNDDLSAKAAILEQVCEE